MKYIAPHPFADPEAAARKLMEISTLAVHEPIWPRSPTAIRRAPMPSAPALAAAAPTARTRTRSPQTSAPSEPCSATPSGRGRSP
jgi:hypothetical protein